jgi:hypothetical protein
MNIAARCSWLNKALSFRRWAILLIPLCLCGCFDSQAAKTQQSRGRGIASISRFFSVGQSAPEEAAGKAAAVAEFYASLPGGISATPDLAQDAAALNIALPAFLGNSRSEADNPFRSGRASGIDSALSGRGRASGFGKASAASILNSSSFSQLFSSIFTKNRQESANLQSTTEDLPNPFTEARLKREAPSPASETSVNKTESEAKSPAKTQDAPKPQSADSVAIATGAGVPLEDQFLLIGDFNGSGRLGALAARRSGDTVFISDDGERSFNLYVNFAALEQQSAFYIDDINADGTADLLVTSRPYLDGGVLLGDGNGGYRLAGRFLTGYEPIIPTAGPIRNGMREILSVNSRSGELKTFIFSDRYQLVQTSNLRFLPNYLLHLMAPDGSREFARAAQTSGSEQIMSWGDDDLLQPTAETLGADPTALITSFKNSSVQVYQVGSYASVVLSSQGKAFNIANLRIFPQTFLVFGDISRQGFVDVAVGTVSYFTPKKQ